MKMQPLSILENLNELFQEVRAFDGMNGQEKETCILCTKANALFCIL